MNADQTDLIIQKTASVAFTYYPEIMIDSPDFNLWTEVDYCLEDIAAGDLKDEDAGVLRTLVARAIVNPTEHREMLNDFLLDLTADSDSESPAQ